MKILDKTDIVIQTLALLIVMALVKVKRYNH
jgi:hypothetical protein